MNFKRRFDYNDINNFLPDNYTMGTTDYFLKKFNDKLPNGYCQLLEAKSRIEYTEKDVNNVINDIILQEKVYSNKLIAEYEQRKLEGENKLSDDNNINNDK